MNRKAKSGQTRSSDDLRIAVIGAGMAGILTAIKLQEAGLSNYVVYEKADRLGGTWRENSYPGIACDVPSHHYCYSFEPNPDWSQQFSPGSEIQAYFERIAQKYGVDREIRFDEEITRCEFTGDRWKLEMASGLRDEADIMIAATGVLHHPNDPDIEGLANFEGARFHSSRWDHAVPFAGKRMGVVGTGSTAVQITGGVIDEVSKLSLFQRTAQWILPQENARISEEQKREFRQNPAQLRALHAEIAQLFADNFANAVVDADSPQMKNLEEVCRANLEENVHDPVLREKLRPSYRAACKRIIFSPDFYQALQRDNAELVTESIERVEATGVRTSDGRLHELDILVLATGFRVDRFMRPMEIVGRDGKSLNEIWAKRPSAYLSVSVPDLPNFFMLNGPNGPVGNFSLIEVAELQLAYILQLVEGIRSGDFRHASASAAATEAFDAKRVEAAKKTIWMTGCSSWYLDDRGIPAVWPWTYDRFKQEMAKPDLSAFKCTG